MLTPLITLSFLSILGATAAPLDFSPVKVPAGAYEPLFKDKGEDSIKVDSLIVDAVPVTNEKFLEFVKKNPRWKKGVITPIYADKTYLEQWPTTLKFAQGTAKYPVVHVSWFAARAYCRAHEARLPTMAEWEYFSQTQDPRYEAETLKWYAQVLAPKKEVGMGPANKLGIYDTTGLVWEWVEDFSSAIMAGDSREGPMRDMFCGGASLGSKDPRQYAAFMRYAFRSSLKAQYTTSTLGFRCVKDADTEKK